MLISKIADSDVNHCLNVHGSAVARRSTLLWSATGIVAVCRSRCGSCVESSPLPLAGQPRRMLLVLLDSLKSAPPPIQVQLESVPSGADATTSVGPGLQDPLLDRGRRARCRFLRHLRAAKVPAGDRSSPGDPHSRRLRDACHHHHRSQPGGRGTQARRPPAQGASSRGRKSRSRRRRSARGRLAVPDPTRADRRTCAAEPLIACIRTADKV